MILAVWFSTCHGNISDRHRTWSLMMTTQMATVRRGGRVGSRAGISTHHLFLPQICSQDDHHHQSWGEYQSALFLLLGHFQLWDFPSQVRCQHFPQAFTRHVGAILARHCHCIFINEGNVLKATNGNELINEILICITFKVERMGKVNKLITVAANELRKYLSVKFYGKNSRMNCSEPKNWETRSRYCGNV